MINENGMVVGFHHCKNKAFEKLKPALHRIWSKQHPSIKTHIVWTDDVRSDGSLLKRLYKIYRPECELRIGQVKHKVK